MFFKFLTIFISISTILSEEWPLITTGPWGSREGLMGVYHKGYVYLSGGRYSPDGFKNINQSIFYNDVWRINSTCYYSQNNINNNCNWEPITNNAQWQGRAYHIMFMHTINNIDYFYIIGGQNLTYFYGDVWRSSDALTWELVKQSDSTQFHQRAGLAATGNSPDGNMYMCCGCFNESSNRVVYNDLWVSKDGTTWNEVIKSSSFEPRSGPRMDIYDNNLYLIAGEYGFHELTQYGDVWKLDISNENNIDNWVLVNSHAFVNRSGHGFSINHQTGEFYVVAGYYDLHDLHKSTDYGLKWRKVSENVFNCENGINNCGRFDFWSLIDENENNFWIYGGSSSWSTFGNLHNQTYRIDLKQFN